MSAHTVLVHWCRTCQAKRVAHPDEECGGCVGAWMTSWDPITRWPATPPRPGRWARTWTWLAFALGVARAAEQVMEKHLPDLTADLGGDE